MSDKVGVHVSLCDYKSVCVCMQMRNLEVYFFPLVRKTLLHIQDTGIFSTVYHGVKSCLHFSLSFLTLVAKGIRPFVNVYLIITRNSSPLHPHLNIRTSATAYHLFLTIVIHGDVPLCSCPSSSVHHEERISM